MLFKFNAEHQNTKRYLCKLTIQIQKREITRYKKQGKKLDKNNGELNWERGYK